MKKKRDAIEERQAYDKSSPWWGEHISRYEWASHYLNGKVVFDAACGNGFGCDTAVKHSAKMLIGIDNNIEALGNSIKNFSHPRVHFIKGNIEHLPLIDESIDVILSFETLEHLVNVDACIREFKRVLKLKGLFICSTPNALFSRKQGAKNPFHIHEFTPVELNMLLNKYFRTNTLLYQINDRQKNATVNSKILWYGLNLRGIRKLPHRLKESLSHLITGKPLYPGGEDFKFIEDYTENAETIIGVSEKNR